MVASAIVGRRNVCHWIRHAGDDLIEHETCVADIAQALLRIALEARASSGDSRGGVSAGSAFQSGVARQHRGERVGHVLALERAPAGQHLVEHEAERPDVGALVDGLPRACSGAM